MRVRRIAATVAATVMVAGIGVAGASPASAVSVGCSYADGVSASGRSSVSLPSRAYSAGETITVTWSNLELDYLTVVLQVPVGTTVNSRVGPGSVSYTFPADVTTSVGSSLSREFDRDRIGDFVFACTEPAPAPPGPVVVDASPIPAWVQASGRASQDANCPTGWSPSWQKWAEPVTGGWVCTRTIPSLG